MTFCAGYVIIEICAGQERGRRTQKIKVVHLTHHLGSKDDDVGVIAESTDVTIGDVGTEASEGIRAVVVENFHNFISFVFVP